MKTVAAFWKNRMKRYEALAEELAQSIGNGTLKVGDRLPSVRQVSRARGLSASTVFEAYYLLEARGLVRARERSGYYVAAGGPGQAPEAAGLDGELKEALPVAVDELVFSILASAKQRSVVPLGSAFPSPLLYPLERLARMLARGAAAMDPWSTVDDIGAGSLELRRHIAQRYLADGMQVQPDDIVLTNGALEALNLSLQAVTKPGDAVVVESPSFYGALQALERCGLKAIEVPACPRIGISLQMLEQALTMYRPTACWLMTTFQNPLGSTMPEAKKQALVEMLARAGVPLIEDDVYGELYFGRRRPLPAKAFDREGLVLHCGSFSKCLAPGYRVGWAIPGRFAHKLGRLKLTSSLSVSVPIQLGLCEYLSKGGYDRHLRQLREAFSQQQAALADAVSRHFPPGTRVSRPAGGYFLWVELPAGADALALQREACALGISLAPGPMFSARAAFGNCMRLNYGHPWSGPMASAVATLGRLAAAQLAQPAGVAGLAAA
jgi:DNA-binding transcriptional MocR family regulator